MMDLHRRRDAVLTAKRRIETARNDKAATGMTTDTVIQADSLMSERDRLIADLEWAFWGTAANVCQAADRLIERDWTHRDAAITAERDRIAAIVRELDGADDLLLNAVLWIDRQ